MLLFGAAAVTQNILPHTKKRVYIFNYLTTPMGKTLMFQCEFICTYGGLS